MIFMLQFASVVDHADWLAVWVEKEMAAHSTILAWRVPWTGEPGGLLSIGSHSRTRLK